MRAFGGHTLASSCTPNHVHLLARISTDYSLSDLLRQIKASSSKWYREKGGRYSDFRWNDGYSAFTVSPTSLECVKQYLANDSIRHTKQSFEEELMTFLKMQGMEFTPKFLTTTTYTRLIYHVVWSVKNRESIIEKSLQAVLYPHIEQKMVTNGGKLYAVGGISDHIHILVECPKTISTASLVQNLKATSTYLIRSHDRRLANFSWQEGYGVFSVGKSGFEAVSNYVNNQEEHHRVRTFGEEWELFRRVIG